MSKVTDRKIIQSDYNKLRSNIKMKKNLKIQIFNTYSSNNRTYLKQCFGDVPIISDSITDEEYLEIFNYLRKNNIFNILFSDDSMLICQFEFDYVSGNLKKHRLLYLKNPDCSDYKVKTIRIDYDIENNTDVIHPVSHLTLYGSSSRIMINRKMCLSEFIYFARIFIENNHFEESLELLDKSFVEELKTIEKEHIYIRIPSVV